MINLVDQEISLPEYSETLANRKSCIGGVRGSDAESHKDVDRATLELETGAVNHPRGTQWR
ncbi:hypothetical protein I0Q12_02210 [Rhodococcus sp. CX]|uniref:hypothetical protein n=1 Tax=Rhodococcus sp. CX TaxID=2789880 RepID=UPI0018CCDFBE|nr:hypothetical protein [Rhodococcus sp. CX]MBH0118413.1 hypothetical protein [Rhodococcus sp. CX]